MDDAASYPWRIGELAQELGLRPKTIRYYEALGLLPVPWRTEAGYRRYGPADRERLRFILKAKVIGFSLREIGEMLTLRDAGLEPCPHVAQLIERKLATIDAQLGRLMGLRTELLALRQAAAVTTCSSTPICGIIELHERSPVH